MIADTTKGMSPMKTVSTIETAGPDGMLRFSIPVDHANERYRVLVVLNSESEQSSTDERGWPARFWSNIAGSISDETFQRPAQGDAPASPSFE